MYMYSLVETPTVLVRNYLDCLFGLPQQVSLLMSLPRLTSSFASLAFFRFFFSLLLFPLSFLSSLTFHSRYTLSTQRLYFIKHTLCLFSFRFLLYSFPLLTSLLFSLCGPLAFCIGCHGTRASSTPATCSGGCRSKRITSTVSHAGRPRRRSGGRSCCADDTGTKNEWEART